MEQPRWTPEMDRYLRDNTPSILQKDIALKLGVSYNSVRYRIGKLGLGRTIHPPIRPTPKMDEYLRENYMAKSQKEMALELRISIKAVQYRVEKLGLEKPRSLRTRQSYERNPALRKIRAETMRKAMLGTGKLHLEVSSKDGNAWARAVYKEAQRIVARDYALRNGEVWDGTIRCVKEDETCSGRLEIDHINGDGVEERESCGANSFYLDIAMGRRDTGDLRILCTSHNHRHSKHLKSTP